jgi:hypothetical protein
MAFLERLAQAFTQTGAICRVCILSAPTEGMRMPNLKEIQLEKRDEHHQATLSYTKYKLQIGHHTAGKHV